MRIKTGDTVKITTGKDRGKSGKVIQVLATERRVVVEGTNKIKRHLRAKSRSEKGQVLELFAPVPVANVALVCPKCSKATRVGYRREGGVKLRACRKCQETI
ncbi:MAG: 50S ribosomal protein L24 [Candidatus Magasanikbacteria bacterium]|nr:50S ribosomal protein L24 [Candidatus Magasanikbacteria bacterium]